MPFRSKAQRRFMHANHPEIAARWEREYPNPGPLPEHVNSLHGVMREVRRKHRKKRRHRHG